ncbi:TPA: hypothetical protein N0F65_003922 [Lagenidium giganteum]|uniref:Uncharacterized protein n=1 Tax=Lagenidium giganteum TaxID=4803 RepID=A0AAV2Z8X6_9STRA|nr:TPA: hypothetical protein N0F65_003922 [Lagenidium giganteum]
MVEEDGAAARPRRRSHRRTRSPKTLWSEERLNGQVLISIDSGDESSSGDEASLYCVGVNGAAGFCRSSSSSGSSDGGEQSSEDEGYAAPVVGYRELQGLLSSGGDLPRRPPPQSPVRRQPRRNPPHWKAGCGSMPDPIVIDVDESLPARNGHVNRWDQALAAAAAKRNRTQRRAGPPIVYSVPSSSSSSGSDQEDNNVAEEDDDVVMCVSPTRTITPAPTVNTASSVTAAPPPVVPQQQTALASNAPVADIISTVIASAIAPVEIHAMPIKREAVTTYIEPTIPSQQSIAQAETLPFQIEVKAEPVAPSADVPLAVPVAPSAAPTAPRKKVTQPVTQPVTKVEHTLSVPTPSPRAKKRRARGTQKLSDEDAGFLLFHGDREPTTAGMLRLVIGK